MVGAGPHGVAAAAALAEALGPGAVTVVDPHPEPLARWSARARAIAMDVMRSPWVHHVGPRPDDLHRHHLARTGEAPTGWNPPVAVFEEHARTRWSAAAVAAVHASVTGLERTGSGWRARLAGGGALMAERVVVAAGLDPHRRRGLGGAPIPDRPLRRHTGRVAVIGAGHTGATAALRLVAGGATVDVFAPGGVRVGTTDVDPGWLGPKHLRGFARLAPTGRAAALATARVGTTTPATAARLRELEAAGALRVLDARAHRLFRGAGGLHVRAGSAHGPHGPYEEVYEATGYRVDLADLPWLAPCVPRTCVGRPVLDAHLTAAPGLHLLGPLAELELGPAGRNLWGAMRAAERLTAAVTAAPR